MSPVNFSKLGKQTMVLQGKFFDIVSLLAKVSYTHFYRL